MRGSMRERLGEYARSKYATIATALIVGLILLASIGVPNRELANRTDTSVGADAALPEEGDNPGEAGWWWQGNGGGNSSW